jgi:hypothetical protein
MLKQWKASKKKKLYYWWVRSLAYGQNRLLNRTACCRSTYYQSISEALLPPVELNNMSTLLNRPNIIVWQTWHYKKV